MIRDGDWVLYDHNFQLGRTVWKRDNGDGTVTFRTDYRADELLEDNKAHRLESEGRAFGDWVRVAALTPNLYHDRLNEALTEGDDKYVRRFLNDSDNAGFRTSRGRA